MDIHFYVQDEHESIYEVGQAVMPVVPRIGEAIALELSLHEQINPHSHSSMTFFTVKSVSYEVINLSKVEEWMQPPRQTVVSDMVEIIVEPTNDATRDYVARIIAAAQEEE